MTKSELIAALAKLPDGAQVLINSWPDGTDNRGPGRDDLFEIKAVHTVDDCGPGAPAFYALDADVAFVDKLEDTI
jgi:hypothetical protein